MSHASMFSIDLHQASSPYAKGELDLKSALIKIRLGKLIGLGVNIVSTSKMLTSSATGTVGFRHLEPE
jgi:hypothetical protein